MGTFMTHQQTSQSPAPNVWCSRFMAISLPPAPVSATWAEGPFLCPQRVVNIPNSTPSHMPSFCPLNSLLAVFLPISTHSLKSRSNPPFHSYKGFQAIPEPPMPTATGGRQRLLGEWNKLIFVNHYNSAWHIVMAIKVLGNKYNKIINIFIKKNDLWGTEYSWGWPLVFL